MQIKYLIKKIYLNKVKKLMEALLPDYEIKCDLENNPYDVMAEGKIIARIYDRPSFTYTDVDFTVNKMSNDYLNSTIDIQRKIAESFLNKNWISKNSAIKVIDEILLPTLNNEADILFWKGISTILKNKYMKYFLTLVF